jgi:lipid-binding SYLF domain-containing protein
MKLNPSLLVLLMFLSSFAFSAEVEDYSSSISVFKESAEAKPYFATAYGFAMFPTVGKGGFGVGAAHGKGQVYHGGKVTGKTTLTHLSIGFQAGGQAFSQIIFFEDKRAYDEFIRGNFEFDAQASAVAITAGAQAQAGTAGTTAGASSGPRSGVQAPTRYNKGMATFVHAKGGLMYEAAVGGQKFKFTPL